MPGARPAETPATVAVVDIGKTNVKLSAVTADGRVLETLATVNAVLPGAPWRRHDLAGLSGWLFEGLAELARRHPLERVIATGHGSGGMLVGADPDAGGDGLALPMIDYEQPLPETVASAYASLAGSFLDRGSAVMMAATHQPGSSSGWSGKRRRPLRGRRGISGFRNTGRGGCRATPAAR